MKKLILGAVALLLACMPAVQAQKTKGAINSEINTLFPDNTQGQITPQSLRNVTSDTVNSIMPTAPVVSGNFPSFNGTTGLLQDSGIPGLLGVTLTTSGGTINCITATAIQLGCVKPDGTTITINAGVLSAPAAYTPVVGNRIIYVSTAGNDSTGDGSVGNPFATCARAYQLAQTFSLQFSTSNTITISFNNGTFAFDGSHYCQLSGPLPGQISPTQLIYTATSTGTFSNVIFQNTAGYGWGCNFGGMATIQWLTVDGTSNNNDAFNITSGCSVIAGNLLIQHFVNPWNFFSITGAGTNVITINGQTGGFKVQGAGVGTTGTWASSSPTLTVASASGLVVGMGVVAGNSTIPYPCVVTNIVSTTITLNCNTTGTGSGTGLTFYYSLDALVSCSLGASFYLNTNGDPNFATPITLDGSPYFVQAQFFSSNLCSLSIQGATFENNAGVIGLPFQISGGGIIDTGLQGPFYIPATGAVLAGYITQTASVTSGSTTATVASTTNMAPGMSVGGYASPTSTFSGSVSSIVVSANTNISVGNRINHRCIPGGTTVSSVVGTTIGLSHVTTCATSGAETVYFTGTAIGPNNTITSVTDATHFVMAQPATATNASLAVAAWGSTLNWGGNGVR